MQRRQFVRLIGWAAALPLAAHAQQKNRQPVVGLIGSSSAAGEETQQVFATACSELGWVEGHNIRFIYRRAEASQMRATVAELIGERPDILVVNGTSVLNAVREVTNSIPVVFVGISDPEGVGIVPSLARPGGNMTGLANCEPSMGGKWLQTPKEIAPQCVARRFRRIGGERSCINVSGL